VELPSRRPHSFAAFAVAVCTVAAVAALAAGAWWLLRSGEAAPHAVPESRENETALARVDAEVETAGGATPEAVRESGAQSFARAPACVVGPEDGVAVHVVAKEGRTGVAGARVYVESIDDGAVNGRKRPTRQTRMPSSWLDSAAFYFADPGRLADVQARGFLADAHGDARVEWPDAGVMLVGFAEGLRGVLGLDEKPDAPIEFALSKPEDRRIEVVARDGRPIAGALVELARWWSPNGTRVLFPLHRGAITDGSGRARFVGCEILRDAPLLPSADDDGLFVSLPFVGLESGAVATALPPPSHGDEVVRIAVGEPFGIVEVHAVDAKGRRASGDAVVEALEPTDSWASHDSFSKMILTNRSRWSPLENGIARVVPVALKQSLRVELASPTFSASTKIVRGPVVDGETVRVDVTAMKETQSVRGRLVGIAPPLGQDARFLVSLARVGATGNSYGRLEASLEEGARFQIVVPSSQIRDSRQLVFEVTPRDHSAAYGGTISLEGLSDDDEVDVGDVVAAPLGPLVSGRVVDESGRPVGNVAVEVTSATTRRFGTTDENSNRMTTDGAGTFAVFGSDEGADLVLTASPPRGLLAVRIPVEPGSRDLELVLERTGAIEGTVESRGRISLFAQPLDGGDPISAVLASDSGRPEPVRPAHDSSPRINSFRFELRPGRYDVLATGSGSVTHLIARVDGLVVRAGETTTDPRLTPLLLRDQGFHWRVELARRDGGPAPSAWICLAPVDAPDVYWRKVYCATGMLEFDAALESAWVDVYAASFRRVHQLCNPGTVALTLEPVEQDDVAFELAVEASADSSKLEFKVAVDQVPPLPGFLRDSYSSPLAVGGTARVSIDRGARWRARLFVERSGVASGSPAFEFSRLARDVTASSDPVRFEVSAAEVAEARSRLEARKSK